MVKHSHLCINESSLMLYRTGLQGALKSIKTILTKKEKKKNTAEPNAAAKEVVMLSKQKEIVYFIYIIQLFIALDTCYINYLPMFSSNFRCAPRLSLICPNDRR